jgi:ABC-type branched-subunit amino acid transport system permease subunit
VVGYAGLLDLGYVAFFAVGAYLYALLASPHLTEAFAAIAAMFPNGLHTAAVAGDAAGAVAGGAVRACCWARPRCKLRGDYLAIVTLGFGEIIRIFLNNLDHPLQHHQRPEGHQPDRLGAGVRARPGQAAEFGGFEVALGPLYYYLFLVLVLVTVSSASACRIRAWAVPGWPSARTRSRQGHGHQHPQPQAAGLRHGRLVRRRVGRHVRVRSRASCRPSRSA